MACILLVEDAEDYQNMVARTLGHFEVCVVGDADAAMAFLRSRRADLVILDLHLPHRDGYSLLKELQDDFELQATPVICLTGKTSVADKVHAFVLGAEDYVTKPFNPIELRARVDAKIAKAKQRILPANILRAGPIEIDLATHRSFLLDGETRSEMPLTQTEFKILAHFVRKIGREYSREQLLAEVWGADVAISARVVDTHICTLRKKMGRFGRHLISVQGLGYRLVGGNVLEDSVDERG